MKNLTYPEILDAGLADWRPLAQGLHARFRLDDFAQGATFIASVAAAAEAADHHPAVSLTYGVVTVSVCTREDGRWVTAKDVNLARQISELAADQGLRAEPGAVTQLELAIDTADQDRIAPFWAALMTGSAENLVHGSVFDADDRVPPMWFQRTEDHQVPRQRWHPDLWLAPESVAARIEAAVAAGGTVVDDSEAPSFTVLADPDGNRVCICTALDRR